MKQLAVSCLSECDPGRETLLELEARCEDGLREALSPPLGQLKPKGRNERQVSEVWEPSRCEC